MKYAATATPVTTASPPTTDATMIITVESVALGASVPAIVEASVAAIIVGVGVSAEL